MAYNLSFHEYIERRDVLEEGMLKKWSNRIKGQDEDGKSSLTKAHAMRHKDDLTGLGGNVGGVVGNAARLATNVATGNVLGSASSIWGIISNAISGGTKAYKLTKAGMYLAEVQKHMKALKDHLLEAEELDDETAEAIIDAVFEVDGDLFDEVSPAAWAEGTKRFAAGLAGGYEDIANKIFAAVMAQVIREWVEKMGGKVEGMKDAISKLRGQKAQKIDFLEEPEIAEAMSQFEPPAVHKDLAEEVPQNLGVPRTIQQAQQKLIQRMGWPRLPRNGDTACWIQPETGREYCRGKIKLTNPDIFTNWDMEMMKKYGWETWFSQFRVQGGVVMDHDSPCRWHDAVFGYEVKGEDMMKWDAKKNMWLVDYDSD